MANDPYPADFKAKVVDEYVRREDLSLERVATKNGIHHRTLWRWLDKAGICSRPSRPRLFDNEQIWKDIRSGMKKEAIAKKHGCSVSWVYRVQSGHG